MWKSLSGLVELPDQYHGYVVGFAALVAVLLFNQLVYRRCWKSYPTLEEYLTAHPGCDTTGGIVCSRCRQRAAGGAVMGTGRIYRCTWCDTELYRIDRVG
jgi:hypothetical protein